MTGGGQLACTLGDAFDRRRAYSFGDRRFFSVHRALGFGFLEHVYAAALERELLQRAHRVDRELNVVIRYDGAEIAHQRLDLVVGDKVVIEIKSTEHLHRDAKRQLYNYLRATKFEVGLLLHFGRSAKFYRVICTNRENARGPTVNSDAQREPDVHREAP